MMKNITSLVFFSLCIFSTVLAQEKDTTPFRLELSSNQIFTQYDWLGRDGFGVAIEDRLYNYSLQVSAFQRLNQRLDLGIGLGFANRDANGTCYCEFCDKFPLPAAYTKLRSFELPIELRIDWRKEQHWFDPYLSIGLTARMPLEYRNTPEGDTQVRLNKEDFSTGASLGLGSHFYLTEKWSIVLATHVLAAKYFRINEAGIAPSRGSGSPKAGIEEWYVKVGLSKAFD